MIAHTKLNLIIRRPVRTRQLGIECHATTSYSEATRMAKERDISMTRLILDGIDAKRKSDEASGGAGGRTSLKSLSALDEAWTKLRTTTNNVGPAPTFVTSSSQPLVNGCDYDVCVCGGTLGIIYAATLSTRGYRVCVVERGLVRGRDQEWNISRAEITALVSAGILSQEEINKAIAIEFNPVRIQFYDSSSSQSAEVWTRDILNLGVSPVKLIEMVKERFIASGGRLIESCALQGITSHPDGVVISAVEDSSSPLKVTARLVIDCMGHNSPIVQQVRWGNKPDGVCCVVGSMASGFPTELNTTGDVIATASDLSTNGRLQLFWEAFPSSSGPSDRTTYMFTYLDADPSRPSLAELLDLYWKKMPEYQGIRDQITAGSVDIDFKRILFGYFPTYRDSPLQPSFDRVVQVGDASGIQSPLSFGGFGALTRHLDRIIRATTEALDADLLDKGSLSLLNSYNPALSSAWMLQRAMSVRPSGPLPKPDLINKMLAGNFKAMSSLGDAAMRPFLQDVLQFNGLVSTMANQMINDPLSIPPLLIHVGPGPLMDWLGHVAALGTFTQLHFLICRLLGPRGSDQEIRLMKGLNPKQRYQLNRYRDALEFGSGMDFH
jgi:flavin-dependent dehydrogenase